MTNAEKIRNMSDEELAETYITTITLNAPHNGVAYMPKHHMGEIYFQKEDAIQKELDWLK